MLRAVVVTSILASSAIAHADRPLCYRGARYHGAPIDLDVKDADVHDVMRLLADVGNVNIVVSDEVQGRVTLRLKKVPWDQVTCTIAATKNLSVTINGNVVLVKKP